ncbi:transmembrane protein, putative [Medicago truncatula]|uniref:Transmembrane protein, putative n=1 Tax=Medicago truncatula TaxID=3880 RepID=G7K631_MEDTR|nr:transmembrane protein, putative [Medicago truncatula]
MVADVLEVSGRDDGGWNTSKSTVIFPIPHTNFFTNNSRHYYSYTASGAACFIVLFSHFFIFCI